ncbi:MAG: PDZ domain-containing protein [Deltaproteobacteria bacterium]
MAQADGKALPAYDVFISCRNVEPDRTIARHLYEELNNYKIPRGLLPRGVPPKLQAIYLDEQEDTLTSALSDEAESALRNSRFFILICSPRTPGSLWIERLIEVFHEEGRYGKILPLLIEKECADSFPQPMRRSETYTRIVNGIPVEKEIIREPLAADIRRDSLEESLLALKGDEKLRLLAPIIGCRFDELKQRHHHRVMRKYKALAVTILAAGILFGGASFWVWQSAEQHRVKAEKQYLLSIKANHIIEQDLLKSFKSNPAAEAQVKAILYKEIVDMSETSNSEYINKIRMYRHFGYVNQANETLAKLHKAVLAHSTPNKSLLSSYEARMMQLNAYSKQVGYDRGIFIAEVVPGSPAAAAGLQYADILVKINGDPLELTNTDNQLNTPLFRELATAKNIRFTVLRINQNDQLQKMDLEFEQEPKTPWDWLRHPEIDCYKQLKDWGIPWIIRI